AIPVCTVKALVEYTRASRASTLSEYMSLLNIETAFLKSISISHQAGTDLFLRFITNIPSVEFTTFQQEVIERGSIMVGNCEEFRSLAAAHGVPFIKEGSTVLVHSYSRLVLLLLKKACTVRHFKVYVTAASFSQAGKKAVTELRRCNIPAALIADAAIGYTMEKVDLVLVGAEGVVRNGGLINQIGTLPIAVMAKVAKKPVYCVCESYKFVDVFPLNQNDLDFSSKTQEYFDDEQDHGDCLLSNPEVDYTPPEYISMLFTNEGVLTPPSVSELMLRSGLGK
ncbi:Translation initiation factor, partial [Kappamyces sp. JEL0829]